MGRGEPILGSRPSSDRTDTTENMTIIFPMTLKGKKNFWRSRLSDGFSCKLLSSSTYAMHEQTAVCVQSSLAEIGIKVELELPDWATRIERSM